MGVVRLTPVAERVLQPLLSLAVAETAQNEVMPPIDAPPGWSEARRRAFCNFYRSHHDGLGGPTRTEVNAILCDGEVVGMIRMARRDDSDSVETGMWLGKSARGQGIGVAALQLLLGEAALVGAHRVVAETTAANVAAIGVLRRCGAVLSVNGAEVHAEIPIDPGIIRRR
jgi:RimJ/RimL family protein N-acetyltransferase